MSELTTSKINRQFRTLRSKCVALNAINLTPSGSKPTVTVTYGHNSRSNFPKRPQETEEAPPLAILQSLDAFGNRLHLDRAIVENMLLSKRIYEVRDAFRNIVKAAFGPSDGGSGPPPRVPSLTSICARLIGEHVQSESEASLDAHPHPQGREDGIRSEAVDELYESVPAHYRQYTLVAHALTFILATCPRHPTLLNALLEVCLATGLGQESRTILSELFLTAILPRPNSTYPCPLAHPAHKNFLTTLRETCHCLSVTAAHKMPLVCDRTFAHILVDALSQPYPERMHAWTSKAVIRLARDFRKQDFAGCFVLLCSGLAQVLAQPNSGKKKLPQQCSKLLEDVQLKLQEDGLERLAKWVVSMLDVLHKRALNSAMVDDARACMEFLVDIEPLRLHISSTPLTSPARCLADALCCLAAYCLASPPTPTLSTADPDLLILETLLRNAHVKNTTFDGLVSHILPLPNISVFRMPLADVAEDSYSAPSADPTVGDCGIRAIDALAAPLRARGLPRCESSLYLAALQHVEELISAPPHMLPPGHQFAEKDLYDLRLQLMDRIEDAERRCFGSMPVDVSGRVSRPGSGDCELVWEELVGSWVVKSPAIVQAKRSKEQDLQRATKRRKLDDCRNTQADDRLSPRSDTNPNGVPIRSLQEALKSHRPPTGPVTLLKKEPISSSSLSTTGKRKFSETASQNASFLAPSPHRYGDLSSDSDSDDSEIGQPTPAPKRTRNFATILADAQMNVISLRAEREAKAKAQAKAKPRASAPARIFAVPESPASASHACPRRQSNFATAIADSHRNVISLREERERAAATQNWKPTENTAYSQKTRLSLAFGRKPSTAGLKNDVESEIEQESSPMRPGTWVEPSSDDALNLFAYPDSSPVVTRRRELCK